MWRQFENKERLEFRKVSKKHVENDLRNNKFGFKNIFSKNNKKTVKY